MKQVCLLSLFVAGAYVCTAQNISSTDQLAYTITKLRLSLIDDPVDKVYPENIIDKKFKGTWVSYSSNGNLCDSGYLLNGKPHGLWKSWYPNGQPRVQMQCDAKRLDATRSEMERIYKPGYSPGPAIREMRELVLSSPYPYEKFLYRQLYLSIHPPRRTDSSEEQVLVLLQSSNSPDLVANTFTTSERPFTECMVHGNFQSWFEDGFLQDSGYCDNGIRQGVWQEWDESMNLRAFGFYKNGLRRKDWRYFTREGKLEYIKWFNRLEEVTETIEVNSPRVHLDKKSSRH